MEIYKTQTEVAQKYMECKDDCIKLRCINESIKKEHNKYQEVFEAARDDLEALTEFEKKLSISKNILSSEKLQLEEKTNNLIQEKETLIRTNSELRERLINMTEDLMNKENEINSLSQIINRKKSFIDDYEIIEPEQDVDLYKSLPLMVSLPPRRCLTSIQGHEVEGESLIYNSNGSCLISSGNEKHLKVWDSLSLSERPMIRGFTHAIISMRTSFTDEYLFAGCSNAYAYLWSLRNGRIKHTLTGHAGKINGVGFLSGNHEGITASEDKTVRCWEMEKGYCIQTLGTPSIIYALEIMSSERCFLTGHKDGHVRMYSNKSKKPVDEVSKQNSPISSLCLSPCGNLTAIGTRENMITIVDMRMLDTLHNITHKLYQCPSLRNTISFSKDSRYLIAGSFSGDIIIWDTIHGTVDYVLKGSHKKPVVSVQWSPYENNVASLDTSGLISVWA